MRLGKGGADLPLPGLRRLILLRDSGPFTPTPVGLLLLVAGFFGSKVLNIKIRVRGQRLPYRGGALLYSVDGWKLTQPY